MPQLVRSSNITVVNGEDGVGRLHITLDLNLTLNQSGDLQVTPEPPGRPPATRPSKEDCVEYPIPDFGGGESISFGKQVDDKT